MKITENQIRRIIRQTLHESILREAKRANNWDEYIKFTVSNNPDLDIAEAEVAQFVEEYKQVLAEYLGNYKNQNKDKEAWQISLELQKSLGFRPTQSDSYKDFISWYGRANNSENGKKYRGTDKWLHTYQIMDIIETLQGLYDTPEDMPVSDGDSATPGEDDGKNKGAVSKWFAEKLAKGRKRRQDRKEKRTERKSKPEQDKRTGRIAKNSVQFKAADLDGDGRISNSELQKWQSGGGSAEFEKNK